jgi:hypothetical protein
MVLLIFFSSLFLLDWLASLVLFNQGCESGSGLDPDSVNLWIRIRIGNPDPGSGSRCKKIKKGMGTLLKILHLSYSFGQKCSKLGTFTVKGLKIQKRE